MQIMIIIASIVHHCYNNYDTHTETKTKVSAHIPGIVSIKIDFFARLDQHELTFAGFFPHNKTLKYLLENKARFCALHVNGGNIG